MISNPKTGDLVQLWYKNRTLPHHGKTGRVLKPGRKRPRNHLVLLDGSGESVIVPAGNLRRP